MDELKKFLQNQKLLQISPKAGDPWIANIYMCCESPEKIYFIGSPKTKYGEQLLQDPELAFATAWFDKNNHTNRKGIQGVGEAVLSKNEEDIAIGVKLHNQNYPEFSERISVNWINTNDKGSGVWVIKPTFIKFWNDSLFGQDGSKNFEF